jgi:hypothetical protein
MNRPSRANLLQNVSFLIDDNAAARTLKGWESGSLCINTTYAAGDVTYTLPDGGAALPDGASAGSTFTFVKTHATNNVIITPAAGDTIYDGTGGTLATVTITQPYTERRLVHLGSGAWLLVGLPAAFVRDLSGTAKITTANVVAGGGSITGHIHLGGTHGIITRMQLTALGDTVDTSMAFAPDPAMAGTFYSVANEDMYTAPFRMNSVKSVTGYVTAMTDDELCYYIQNDGANDSAYEIELTFIGGR